MWALHHELVLFLQSRNCFWYVPDNDIEGDILGWNLSVNKIDTRVGVLYSLPCTIPVSCIFPWCDIHIDHFCLFSFLCDLNPLFNAGCMSFSNIIHIICPFWHYYRFLVFLHSLYFFLSPSSIRNGVFMLEYFDKSWIDCYFYILPYIFLH